MKDITQKPNFVIIKLHYSPKELTLRRKFGNLPIKYCRLNVDSESELYLFEKAIKQFSFNCILEDDETAQQERKKLKTGQEGSTSTTTALSTSTITTALPTSTDKNDNDETPDVLDLDTDYNLESQVFH